MNILPNFCVDYSSKEGAVETSIFKIFRSKSLDITASVLHHAQSLASRLLAAEGWRPATSHELASADPYATLASASLE